MRATRRLERCLRPITASLILLAGAICFTPRAALAVGAEQLGLRAVATEVGVFEILGDGPDEPAPRTAMGVAGTHTGLNMLIPTTTLEAAQAAAFGFRYEIRGAPDGEVDGLEIRALHPLISGPSGIPSKTSVMRTYAWSTGSVATGSVIYSLDDPAEIIPGVWTLQLLRHGRVLLSQEFILR